VGEDLAHNDQVVEEICRAARFCLTVAGENAAASSST
jgi:hypothetical protein